jgi:peptidyl-prolyl cis-trans isomerase B (cyclophilin B)
MSPDLLAHRAWPVAAVLLLTACSGQGSASPSPSASVNPLAATVCPAPPAGHTAVAKPRRQFAAPPSGLGAAPACAFVHTAGGVISIRLRPDLAPRTVDNFEGLARSGFYDGLSLYRACPDTSEPGCYGNLIEGGDPRGDGTGGPGYDLALEPVKGRYLLGAVAMAAAGDRDSGSRFFISRGDNRALSQRYNLFGQVTSGLDVLVRLPRGALIDWVAIQAG